MLIKSRLFETATAFLSIAALAQQQTPSDSLRSLAIVSSTASGRACRANCLDQGLYFCVASDHQSGVCCDKNDEECRQENSGMCSFDISAGYSQGYYAVCPYDERVCGASRVITVEPLGSEQTVTSVGNPRSSDFIFGQLCSYEIVWPEQASDGDHFIIEAKSVA